MRGHSQGFIRGMLGAALMVLALGGCATLRQFGPSVEVSSVTPGEYIALKRGDILTTGRLSANTRETLRVTGLDDGVCAKPGLECIEAMNATIVVTEENKRSALAEMWLQHALTLRADGRTARRSGKAAVQGGNPLDANFQLRLDGWMEVARQSYAYLFFTERTASERAFEDRQTQVRDYYNLAVQEASVLLFEAYSKATPGVDTDSIRQGKWHFLIHSAGFEGESVPGADGHRVRELIPASSLSFTGSMRSVHRRDGFGAELVAVMDVPAMGPTEGASRGAAISPPSGTRPQDTATPAWSEMPSPSVSVLMRFSGRNLAEVLADDEPELVIHDPYQVAVVEMHDQRVPLAANFTAGYGLWLARSGFSRQSLRSLFGGADGIVSPHLFLMQPYDPDRRILLMIHGLASSPEAWVNVANELMADERIRGEFQIWQFYYPTNMPIAVSHDAIRRTLADALRSFDPQGRARASKDMVVVGHSMGGVISRLMVSSSGDALWNKLVAARDLDDGRLREVQARVGSMLRFEPVPHVERVVFIAAPHRGTDVAGTRLGHWMRRLIRLPLTILEDVAYVLQNDTDSKADSSRGGAPVAMNGIDNLDKDDPFVRASRDLPISPAVRYHSIIARAEMERPLKASDDGLVPYWSSHLPGALSEKIIHSGHSVQEATPAIVELRRILHEDIRERGIQP